jgi:hypothetical protein
MEGSNAALAFEHQRERTGPIRSLDPRMEGPAGKEAGDWPVRGRTPSEATRASSSGLLTAVMAIAPSLSD